MEITIPNVRDFKFDPKKGCHCQKFWPQFQTFGKEDLQKKIEAVIARNDSTDIDQYKEALRLIQIYTHESFLQACQIMQDVKYGLEFYQTHGETPGHILAFMQCCR